MDTKRFNKPEYKSQIRAVRNYRRQVQAKPETNFQRFLFLLGLGSWKNRILAAMILAFLVYLAYFASFLKLKNISIQGADQNGSAQISQQFQQYIGTYALHLLPRRNILFFNPSGFEKYLLANDYQVAKVNSIHRKLWHQVDLDIEPRIPQFVLQQNNNYYILNTDSTIGSQLAADQLGGSKVVVDTADEQLNSGEKFLDDQQNSFLQYINDNVEKKLSLQIQGFEVPGRASDQLTVILAKGFKVFFNTKTDPNEYLGRLFTLWNQLTPDQQNRLDYFDLRFEKNAYGCYKSDPCATSN